MQIKSLIYAVLFVFDELGFKLIDYTSLISISTFILQISVLHDILEIKNEGENK